MKNSSVNSAGLRGQVAGETELCTVGQSGTGLTYRGYEITDLAENAEFEEIAFLLLKGHFSWKYANMNQVLHQELILMLL